MLWVTAEELRQGRIIRLDARGSIIPHVSSRDRPLSFSNADVKVVDTGARYAKMVRLDVPSWCRTLHTFYSGRLFSGPPARADADKCVFCYHRAVLEMDDDLRPKLAVGDPAYRCRSCALVAHVSCAQSVWRNFINEDWVCARCREVGVIEP